MSNGHAKESRAATIIRRLAVPIILFWVAIAAVTNATVPQLEVVGEERSAPLNAADAPSTMAMRHIGKVFNEFDSDSSAMVVLEGDKPLGAQAHEFYNTLVQRLKDDREHVQHVADYWGDPITAGGSQSKDGKAAYVQVYVAGNQGEALSNQSVDAVRRIVADTPAPDGVKAYVSGEAPTITDQFEVGNAGSAQVTLITFAVIAIMLLIVYRSLTTTALVLVTVLVELSAARGIVAALAHTGVIGLSTYATNLLTMLAIAAGTDYAIFFVGRYQEARSTGEDRLAAYQTMFKSTAHVIIGSGLTVAGALLCLSFTRLPYFQTLGVPAALGVLVTLAAALTMAPAVLVIGSRFGLMEPKRAMRTRGWRRIGTAIVRWPGPILVVSCVVTLIGVLALPGYKTTYDGRIYMPESTPSNVGYAAAERHFSVARLNPELLMIETDFDMRNPAGMVLLERVAKSVLHARGVALVQSITRPLGTPITHSSIPFQISASSASQLMNLSQQQNQALYLSQQADQMTQTIAVLKNQLALQKQSAAITHEQTQGFQQTVAVAQDLRDKIANFDDQFRPIRNYFYWEPHCFDIPFCAALRSLFDALDGIDELVDALQTVTGSLTKLDALQPKLVDLIPPQIAIQEKNRDLTQSNYAINNGTNTQNEESTRTATELGKAFDDAKNDDSFYLPPEAFDNPAFKRGMKLFMSPDGKAARMIITHQGDPQTSEGIEHINAIKEAAFDAVKATPLADAKIYVAGTASAYKDIADGQKYDLLMAALASLGLILLIMMFLTRSIVAALVIVGTVALSLAASFGMSVVVWQYIFGIPLYWVIFPLAVIILLAVGADYNLLLISRFKEETGAGLKTGIIRAIAGTGGVVTAAGLVFAVTMSSFIFSDLRVLGQIGTTIGLGLLFDTLVVRSFLTPAIATLLGRWFWWPLNVRSRPLPKPFGPKPVGADDATGPIPAGG